MNRFKLMQMLDGVKAQLKEENSKLENMYADTTSTVNMRSEQTQTVKDLEERFNGIKAQLDKLDEQEKATMKSNTKTDTGKTPKEQRVNAKAELFRATMQSREMNPQMAALIDDDSTGGNKFLPKTVANEIITEPFSKNPLRDHSGFTGITNLEIPKLAFSIDDDEFVKDGETAKEIKATGSSVTFGRNKFKVYCDVSETVLLGTNTALVGTVENGLRSGLATKEKKVAFNTSATAEPYKHMSFYSKTGQNYEIKAVKGTSKLKAIKAAIADLEEDFRENAKICMAYADYLEIIEELANGSATLYAAQPEQILGKPAIFCDGATIPIVGDFSYSHFNYDPQMLYERDKNIKTGMDSFVLTAWFDHQIKLKSAFRLAIAETPVTP